MAERAAARPAAGVPATAPSLAGQALAGLAGLGGAGLAGWLALHHPLSPLLALAGVALLAAAQAAWPPLWLIALPALLPWLGLGGWTGWLLVEEMDLAILAVAAGAYLRWAVQPGPRLPASRASRRVRAWGRLLLALWTVSVLVALLRGVHDAGGWTFGWWQGLREPLNALRLAKPTLAALLLLPLWWRLQQRPGQRCADQLGLGLALALAGIGLWCLWERWAFPGVLNMATDYRTTGPFWEAQMGGAALDVGLALTLPFALQRLLVAHRPAALAGAGAVLLVGVYAGLTTFSRIVYLALPAGALLLWWLQRRQQAAGPRAPGQAAPASTVPVLLLCLGIGALGAWMFPTAGYRGMLALLGSAVLLLLLVPRSSGQPGRRWVGACSLGLGGGALVLAVALQLPKGAYVAHGVLTLATAALLLAPAAGPLAWLAAAAGFLAQLGCTVAVAVVWGGASAGPAAAAAALALAAAWWLLGRRAAAPWPHDLRWLAGTGAALLAVLIGVSVFSAGNYMASRLGQTGIDRADRWSHWRDGLALNRGGAATWLGQGLGRYADLYALHNRSDTRPGDVRLVQADGVPVMRLAAGPREVGHGGLLRLSQRIPAPAARGLVATLQVRAAVPVALHAEVCTKHLLYEAGCRIGASGVPAVGPGWQTLRLPLPDIDAVPQDILPVPHVFSVASLTPGQPLDLRAATLTDASGRQLLHNPDFAAGGARWYITSDHNHLPWHAKNMAVHLLVEQGVLGLLALVALSLAALWATLGPLRQHPLAPPLAAALLGCWVVGAVDSVLDMPRVATWLLLLTGMALSLHQPSRARARGGPPA